MFDLSAPENIDSCIPVIIEKNITQQINKGNELILRSKYNGSRDIFLNKTAQFIFSMIDGSNNIDEISLNVSNKYKIDKKISEKDVLNCIGELFKVGLISWKNQNPFLLNRIKLYKNRKVIDCTFDLMYQIDFDHYNEIYYSPNLKRNQIDLDWLISGIITGTIKVYVSLVDEKLECMIVASQTPKISNIVYVGLTNKEKDMRHILRDAFESTDNVLINISTDNENQHQYFKDSGFEDIGLLREETRSGDVYIMSL